MTPVPMTVAASGGLGIDPSGANLQDRSWDSEGPPLTTTVLAAGEGTLNVHERKMCFPNVTVPKSSLV